MSEHDTTSPYSLLLRVGLTDQEAKTYLALLELEAVSIRKVADQTGINRGTTYEAIKKLVNAGRTRTLLGRVA
jgi:sugar-specific transcriptional regulator TrmB